VWSVDVELVLVAFEYLVAWLILCASSFMLFSRFDWSGGLPIHALFEFDIFAL